MNNRSIAVPSIRRPTLADLLRFWRLVVPLGADRFHVLRGHNCWQAQQWPNGSWKKLDLYAVSHHLDQSDYTVSVRWSLAGQVQHAVIDLDSQLKHVQTKRLLEYPELVGLADDEMRSNLAAVLGALGHPPHVLFRSSASRGLHLYIFFDRAYDAQDVNTVLVARLKAHGLGPGDGIVDKVFPSNQALRLPLGVASCLLGDTAAVSWFTRPQPAPMRVPGGTNLYDFGPFPGPVPALDVIAAVEHALPIAASTVESYAYLGLGVPPTGPVHLVRDLVSSIRVLERLSKRTVALNVLRLRPSGRGVVVKGGHRLVVVPAPTGVASGAGTASAGSMGVGATSMGVSTPTPAAAVGAMLNVPAQKGTRHQQRTALINALFRSGMAKTAAMVMFDGWLKLSARAGTSKQLRGASPQTLATHLKDGSGFWDWLVKHGVKPAPAGTARRSVVALSVTAGLPPRSHRPSSPPSSSPSLTTTPRLVWDRPAALAAVIAVDEVRLASISCVWARKKARVLVGLLRISEQKNGPLVEVTIGAKVLDRVGGGRPTPKGAGKRHIDRDTRRPRSPREIVLRELDGLGYLRRLDNGIRNTRASLFKVTLP